MAFQAADGLRRGQDAGRLAGQVNARRPAEPQPRGQFARMLDQLLARVGGSVLKAPRGHALIEPGCYANLVRGSSRTGIHSPDESGWATGSGRLDRRGRWLLAQPKSPREQLLGSLWKTTRRFLDLRHVVESLSGIDALAGRGKGLGLPEQCPLVVGSPGHRRRVLDEGLLQMAQAKQHAAEAGVGQGSRRSDRGGGPVRLQGLVQRTTEHGNVADPQGFLVALIEVVSHVYMMACGESLVSGT